MEEGIAINSQAIIQQATLLYKFIVKQLATFGISGGSPT
jgi:hypothetical protein